MAERNFKVNEPIQLIYQAGNHQSGKTVEVEIYLPSGFKDSNFPDFVLTERDATGTYVGEFTPDTVGEWQAIIHLASGSGQVTRRYSVGSHDVSSVGDAVDIIDGKIDLISSTLDAFDSPPMVS